jgi:hypothetical protein
LILIASSAYAQKPAIAPGWKPGPGLEDRFKIRSTDNLFNQVTTIPVVRFRSWLELDGFDATAHFQNIQITPYTHYPSTPNLLPYSHTQAGVTDVVGIDGMSIVFRIGHAKDGDPPSPRLWRCLTFHHRGCPL